MKFVSKTSNLQIVLKHSIPAEPITGRQGVPGLYVRFQDGSATVENEEMQKMMLAHPGFGRDYIVLEESDADPYQWNRQSKEPEHQITEIEFGHVGKTTNPRSIIPNNPEIRKAIAESASKMAQEMAVKMVSEILKAGAASEAVEENSGKKEGDVITTEEKGVVKTSKSTKKENK